MVSTQLKQHRITANKHKPFHCLVQAVTLDRRRLEDLVFAVLDGGKTERIRDLGDGHGAFNVLFVSEHAENRFPEFLFLSTTEAWHATD